MTNIEWFDKNVRTSYTMKLEQAVRELGKMYKVSEDLYESYRRNPVPHIQISRLRIASGKVSDETKQIVEGLR